LQGVTIRAREGISGSDAAVGLGYIGENQSVTSAAAIVADE